MEMAGVLSAKIAGRNLIVFLHYDILPQLPAGIRKSPPEVFMLPSTPSLKIIFSICWSIAALHLAGCGGGGGSSAGATSVTPRQFAYVANSGSDNVSAFTIDATTGALTPVTGLPIAAGTRPFSIAVSGRI